MNHDDLREVVSDLTELAEKLTTLLTEKLPGVAYQVIEDHVWANIEAAAFTASTIIDAHEQDLQGDPHDHDEDCLHCTECGRRTIKTVQGDHICIYAH